MFIPDSVVNAVPKSADANEKIYSANQAWKRLELVYNNTIEFLPMDMSTLSNVVELYYKGFIEVSGGEALKNASEHLMNDSHSLVALTKHIEKYITPLSNNNSFKYRNDRFHFLQDLQGCYISGRYDALAVEANISKADFDKCYEWASKQRKYILDLILPPEQQQQKSIASEEAEYNRELGKE